MPEFPRREADILELAEGVSIGLKTSPDVFPEPPLGDDQLEPLIESYLETKYSSMLRKPPQRRS